MLLWPRKWNSNDKLVRDAYEIDAKDITLSKAFKQYIKSEVNEIIPSMMGELCIKALIKLGVIIGKQDWI